jgi:glycosyltransferase involved in cell wall biosynthesis
MRVAIVHDYLNQYGGAERVLEVLHQLYPEAPIFTSVYDPDALPDHFRDWTIYTSFLQKLHIFRRQHQWALLLYPTAFERFDLTGYDLVISSSSAWAKGVVTGPHTLHVCYCHAPMRFAWQYHDYLRGENVGFVGRAFLPFGLTYVRLWDELSAQRVDAYVANSREVAGRIGKYYRRQATVINPPVDVAAYEVAPTTDDYFLVVSRLVPYKRLDIVIEAFNRLGVPLKIVGRGRQRSRLAALAGPNIEFLGPVSQDELRRLYSRCRALIWPEASDFGIAPVEVQASGRPVIAYAAGGALETVVGGKTGVFFHQQTPAALIAAVQSFETREFDPAVIRRHAEQYDIAVFLRRMSEFIASAWTDMRHQHELWPERVSPYIDGADAETLPLPVRSEPDAIRFQT